MLKIKLDNASITKLSTYLSVTILFIYFLTSGSTVFFEDAMRKLVSQSNYEILRARCDTVSVTLQLAGELFLKVFFYIGSGVFVSILIWSVLKRKFWNSLIPIAAISLIWFSFLSTVTGKSVPPNIFGGRILCFDFDQLLPILLYVFTVSLVIYASSAALTASVLYLLKSDRGTDDGH